MKRIYYTAIPLDSNFKLQPSQPEAVNFTLGDCSPRRYPIVRILSDTMKPGDRAVIVAVRQANREKSENYDNFLREVQSLNLLHVEIRDVVLEENQNQDLIFSMFKTLLSTLEDRACYYADITFGTKTWPVVLQSVLNYARNILEEVSIEGIYYQEALRQDSQMVKTRIYNMRVLTAINSIVELIANTPGEDRQKVMEVLLEDW